MSGAARNTNGPVDVTASLDGVHVTGKVRVLDVAEPPSPDQPPARDRQRPRSAGSCT